MVATASLVALDRKALRNRVIRRNAIQILIVVAVALAIVGIGYALRESLAARGIAFSFGYLATSAGFALSEGFAFQLSDPFGFVRFSSDMTNAAALIAGLFNTLKVAILAIVAATVMGIVLGVGRLSTNWLIRQICFYTVEFLRNTPLLIQLTFWYVAVVLKFPPLSVATNLGGVIFAQQGVWLPSVVASPSATTTSLIGFLFGLVLFLYGCTTTNKLRYVLIGLGAVIVAWISVVGFPFAIDTPTVGKFRASGGVQLTPEFTAILLAISVNSAAYIGEVVRGAIESLPKGQWEAASSLGFSRKDTLHDVILPQVFRVVLPSFGNQYIGLAKNTSLGIAIGFPDLFNVYGTIANQTGRSMEGVIIVILMYLVLSWAISGLVNVANNKLKIPGAR